MGAVVAGLKTRLTRYTPTQMVVAGLLVAIVVGASITLARWLTAPSYDVLFAGMSPADAAAVVEAVEATGTSYQLVESGATTTVLVPTADVSRLRMSLAAENLPGDSVVGYELLDGQGVTVSTFREQINYQRALEGELARTLMTLDNVNGARVQIVLPRERLYTTDQEPATAAVTLDVAGTLDKEQVAAVTHLVASAVPDLNPSEVTVTDSTGTLLSGGGADALGGDEQDQEAAYAARMEARATSMLAALVGDGKAVVRVQADLDFTQRTRQTELFDPEQVAANRQKNDRESYTSTEPRPQGPLTANPQDGEEPPAATSEYERESGDTDFSVSREITSETDQPGAVSRMTVSVLVDPQAASGADLNAVEDLVANAVGLDADRGDLITVEAMPFLETEDTETVDPALAAAQAEQRTKLIVGLAVAGVLALAVIALIIFLFKSRKRRGDHPGDLDDTLVSPGAATSLGAGARAVDPNAQLGVPSSSAGEADRLRSRVEEHPDAAADVLRGLLASDAVGGRR